MIMLALVLQPFTICFLVSPSNNHDDVRAIGPEEEPPVLCPPRLVVVACTHQTIELDRRRRRPARHLDH